MKLSIIRPSSSYQIRLPKDVHEEIDGRVNSFWVTDQSLLLQLSSYIRDSGDQVSALDRLNSRIGKSPRQWSMLEGKICPALNCDQAAAEFTAQDDVLWLHIYLVWPHLTIYATVSGPKEELREGGNWALSGLNSIELIRH